MVLTVMLMSGTLVSSAMFLEGSGPLPAGQLQGEVAREFLVSEGILGQIPDVLASTPSQGRNFEQLQPLAASDGVSNDQFGVSVAVDGDTVFASAYAAEVGGNSGQGTVYVFSYSGAAWSQKQKLVAADGAADDGFGSSVALAEDKAIIGARWADVAGKSNQGQAYLFERVDYEIFLPLILR